jgi:alpha-tubulin suppressor-like RCC1 family protein
MEDIQYRGGPVMPSVTTYTIYWEPGSQVTTSQYKNLVDGFLENVAADSGRTTNLFGVTPQYEDSEGDQVTYAERFGERIIDTNSYPTSACKAPKHQLCLNDSEIETELERATSGLPTGLRTLYILLLPSGVQFCSSHSGCSFGQNSMTCAYHWADKALNQPLVYAVVPFQYGKCLKKEYPNEKQADGAIDQIAHESIEAITDPIVGTAWANGNGEIADACKNEFGAVSGKKGKEYNQVINGAHYYVQEMWSNRQDACVQRPPAGGVAPPSAQFSVTPTNPAQGETATFDASATSDPGATVDVYGWVFGDGTNAVTLSATTNHAYSSSGYFTAKLSVTDSDSLLGVVSKVIAAGSGATNISALGAGTFHTCAVLVGGDVGCWGRNDFGQLGNGETTCSSCSNPQPTAVVNLGGHAKAIYGGVDHTCAQLENGEVECWGGGQYGQLGVTVPEGESALPVSTGLTASALATGAFHTCALPAGTGNVECWGENQFGQLGDGTTMNASHPVTVENIADASAIAAGSGSYSTCALLSEGAVDCWGENKYGQLGNGTTTNSPTPVRVGEVTGAIKVAVGAQHACALLATGGIVCWGQNQNGQLGNGTTTSSSLPVAVEGITNAVDITAGYKSTCALLVDGTVRCWGSDEYGQLGNGEAGAGAQFDAPVKVVGLPNATSIVSGGYHTCAVLQDHQGACWGRGGFGQLGDGSPTIAEQPIPISPIP